MNSSVDFIRASQFPSDKQIISKRSIRSSHLGEDGESGIVPFDNHKLSWAGCNKDASLGVIHISVDQDVGLHVGLLHGSHTNVCSDCISKQQCSHIWEAEEVLWCGEWKTGSAVKCPFSYNLRLLNPCFFSWSCRLVTGSSLCVPDMWCRWMRETDCHATSQSLRQPWQGFATAWLELSFTGDNLQNDSLGHI